MRQTYATRPFLLKTEAVRDTLLAVIKNLPLDAIKPLQILVREEVKARKLSQNALMWVGPISDIAEQAWLNERKYKAEIWHEFFKREFLPEDGPELDLTLVKDGYQKWDYDPMGNRILIGGTSKLSVRGMAQYIEQVHAFGANLGVQFHANPKENK